MDEKNKNSKKRIVFGTILIVLFFIIVGWFALSIYEYNRVLNDRRPIICFNEKKDVESITEYSVECSGILYRYKEYYNSKSNKLNARELTFLFKEFTRKK